VDPSYPTQHERRFFTARWIEYYLHVFSASPICSVDACPDDAALHTMRTSGMQTATAALVWGVIAYLAVIGSIAIHLLRLRIVPNTNRALLAFVWLVLPWLWVGPLSLSALNVLVYLSHLSDRVPYSQPDLVTFALLAVAGMSIMPQIVLRTRARRQVSSRR
jgi:hypothetical protein